MMILQPFDYLMEKFEELLFEMEEIPPENRAFLNDIKYVSADGLHCRRYLQFLAQTCEVGSF